jgi:hypothetical protein
MNTLAYNDTELITQACKNKTTMKVTTNTLAYYGRELITAAESFMSQTLGDIKP